MHDGMEISIHLCQAAKAENPEQQALQGAIIAAVQSSVAGALGSLRSDVAALDARLGSWWTQQEQVGLHMLC